MNKEPGGQRYRHLLTERKWSFNMNSN